jgi:hypothetical protein
MNYQSQYNLNNGNLQISYVHVNNNALTSNKFEHIPSHSIVASFDKVFDKMDPIAYKNKGPLRWAYDAPSPFKNIMNQDTPHLKWKITLKPKAIFDNSK